MLNLEEFSLLMRESFAFVKMNFRNSDLKEIFGNLDTKKEGWISYNKYFQLIREYMVSKRGSGGNLHLAMKEAQREVSSSTSLGSATRLSATRIS